MPGGMGRVWVVVAAGLLLTPVGRAKEVGADGPPAGLRVAAMLADAGRDSGTADEAYTLPPDKLAKARVLYEVGTALHFGEELWQPAILLMLLGTGGAAGLSRWCERLSRRGWVRSAIFGGVLAAGLFVAVETPAAAIGHFFSLHYGISVEAWGPWLADIAKGFGLTVLIETPLLMLAHGLMRWSPRRYWLWFAGASVPMVVLATFLLPQLIEPLFNQFEPLGKSHPALVRELEKVVARTGTEIPAERMFLMKASEKSNGLNAYVTGIGASKRIVVWDTTADRMPTDETLFIFAHETGHYVLRHIPKGLALESAGCFAFFFAVARLGEWMTRRFGDRWAVDRLARLPGMAVLLLAFSLVQMVAEPIVNPVSRYFEHEADVYGQEAIHGLVPDARKTAVASFQQLGEAYLDYPEPNGFVAWWTYDHPSIQSRARFAEQYDPWVAGREPRFFAKQ